MTRTLPIAVGDTVRLDDGAKRAWASVVEVQTGGLVVDPVKLGSVRELVRGKLRWEALGFVLRVTSREPWRVQQPEAGRGR